MGPRMRGGLRLSRYVGSSRLRIPTFIPPSELRRIEWTAGTTRPNSSNVIKSCFVDMPDRPTRQAAI